MFICGTGNFGHHDHEDENETYSSQLPTPKRSKRSTSFCKIIGRDNSNKNPYADRGLDKFYALLADLDDKKQKIYTQKGSEDISFVRFVYTNDSDHVKPIVVKVKNQDKNKGALNKQLADNKQEQAEKTNTEAVAKEEPDENTRKKKKYSLRCNPSFKLENLRQPYYYFPVIVVLILLFLAVYGRSFAILCTSIGWYLVPSVVVSSSSSSNQRKPKRKKEYVRKISEKKIAQSEGPSSPKSVINGPKDRR
ncbi:hypothetical protein CDL12_22313 [Handroanthus impetiginosus]|uniref:ZCF37 n=1 Tax=Handroanthus impetiginosus TaxID=429701 RepID=A0A2G9GIN3_9LAMI|nr:hypothetical protein CDL12_22313 [Handroanthus impetiginosus]